MTPPPPRRTIRLARPPLVVPTTIVRDRRRKISVPTPSVCGRVNEGDLREALRIAEAAFAPGRPSPPEVDA
jgi:hypothetical protein